MTSAKEHSDQCDWHVDQYPWECTCGVVADPASHRPSWIGPINAARDFPTHPDFGKTVQMAAIDDGHTYSNGDGERAGNWMQTYSGRQFWPLDPRADEIYIEDIAHALSMACRFGGHCNHFYSVAEHSVLVSQIVPPELALMGLLHDASEAYVCDIPRPLKPFLNGCKAIEDRVWRAIAERFGLPVDMPQAIKDADNAVLLAEAATLLKPHPAPWNVPGAPADVDVRGLVPYRAELAFLDRFRALTV